MPLDFSNSVIFQIFRDAVRTNRGIHIAVEDDTNCLRFFLVDYELAVDQFIAIRSKSTIPFALTGFLDAPFHCLDANIFALNLCDC